MNHPPVELLIQHALGMSTAEATHIEDCVECAGEVEEFAAIGKSAPRISAPVDLVELAATFDEEKASTQEMLKNASAREIVRALYSRPAAGSVQALIEAIPAARRADPVEAIQIAEELATFLETRPAAALPLAEEMRIDTLREVAACARVLGQYDLALERLRDAETIARNLPAGDYLLARVWYERAGIEVSREGSAAREWAGRAADAFLRYGDTRRHNRSRYLVAISHSNDRNFRRAIAELETLLPDLDADGDVETRAAAWSALGQALSKEGHLDRSSDAFTRSLQLYQSLDSPSESLRARWALARADMKKSNIREARLELEQLQGSFRQLGLDEEASLAGLDLCECLLIEGEAATAAHACREALEILQDRFAGREQLRAIAYLREISLQQLDARKVNYVSTFLESSADDGTLVFSRPSL